MAIMKPHMFPSPSSSCAGFTNGKMVGLDVLEYVAYGSSYNLIHLNIYPRHHTWKQVLFEQVLMAF